MGKATADAVNPFRYGALALGEAFTDREDELEELKADIRNGQDVVVFAPRRYGKSSLIWRVAQELDAEEVLVARVDLMATPTREKLAEKLAQTIHEDIASPLFRARERLRVFAGLRVMPTVTVDPEDGSVSFSFDARRREADVDATLEALFSLPGRLGAERGRRVALVLDEFQEVDEIDPGLPRLMRSSFQAQPEVAHVYLGSKRHMMERIFSDENEPFWRSAKQMELDVIAPEPFRDYARRQFERTGKRVARDTVDLVLGITRGHPYGTQELLYFLWEVTSAGETAEREHLDEALTRVLRSEHAHLSSVWERATGNQKLVLLALANEHPGRPLSDDYQRRHNLPVTAAIQAALDSLTRAELVTRLERGEYGFAEPFLGEWILRNES